MVGHQLHLSQDPRADGFLSESPLALLIGMVLDQQVPLERAFTAPKELEERLGRPLTASDIANTSPEELNAAFSRRPALHRFPSSNAKRVQDLCRIIADQHDDRAEAVWEEAADGDDLLRRVKALPGFGDQKARIFVALLGKQLGVRPSGWEQAAGKFGRPGTHMSVADITGPASLDEVRAYKRSLKA